MSLEQMIGSLLLKNINSPEVQGMLNLFGFDSEKHLDPAPFIMENIIKSYVKQFFNEGQTGKMLQYFGYNPEKDGDPVEFLMLQIANKTEDIKENNEFEEEMKMIEEETENNSI